ncbi:MAG: D-methionine transport system ATP-binding protein, partial [Streptomyces sp.]|nr:D-methionine transport system ATP-binding protein [Streptomyces sp.]
AGSVYDVFARPQTAAAERFIGTTLRDRPSAATLARLRATHSGRFVSVRVRDQEGFQTRLARTFLDHEVGAEIVFGGIRELQERPVGSLTFVLAGPDEAVDAALADLRADGVDITEEITEEEA